MALPFVSALLVTYNEGAYIEKALGSLINQTYPADRYEIIIVDGGSDDDTLGQARKIIDFSSKKKSEIPKVTFLNNPKRILAAGWNIGIKASSGKYVVRIDAHAEAMPNFLQKSVETAIAVGAECVGGRLITVALDEKGIVIRDVLSSSFGVGNSSFRVSEKAGYADTAVYGLYKKDLFQQIGYFDEGLVRNQDIELHTRIKKAGGKFYFNPEIVSKYYSRNTVKKMLNQGFQNGKWNFITLKKNRTKLSIRHVIPLCFVIFLISGFFIGFGFHVAWMFELSILLLYFILAFIASRKKTKKVNTLFQMMGLFFLLHSFYGAGSLVGIFTKTKEEK